MKALSVSELLTFWVDALHMSWIQKSLLLISGFYPEIEPKEIEKLSIGERDTMLFEIRRRLFGMHFNLIFECPVCKATNEWDFNMTELFESFELKNRAKNEFSLTKGDYKVWFKLPDSNDIIKVISAENIPADAKELLLSCLINARQNNKEIDKDTLPDTVLNAIGKKIEKLDPKADIRFKVNCIQCKGKQEVIFDILTYLWTEINHWAKRLLKDVYTLSREFGWSERDILELHPQRRSMYVEMVNA